MKQLIYPIAAIALAMTAQPADACTNLIAGKKATTDGSVLMTYAADSHNLYGMLTHTPAADHKAGEMRKVVEWDTGKPLGEIPQVAHTYNVVGNMNEHQLAIGESTWGGHEELVDTTGNSVIDYGSLIQIALERATNARDAIKVMTDLVEKYGYASSGESFSVADKNEVWVLEMIGKGAEKGAVWVAVRIPDDAISGHANEPRIRKVDFKDKKNVMHSPDVISFARKRGYFNGKDEDFSFADAYCHHDQGERRGCDARVWSYFRRFQPEAEKYFAWVNFESDEPMPLYIIPARKVSLREMQEAMRDHFEGTPMDMTADIGAGGSACPYRWRPMEWEWEGETYVNERATATQQTGFWFVAQARSYLPDAIGGVLWFGVDDAATSALTPIYCGTTEVPPCFSEENGSLLEYSDTAAFWIFNRVAQFAYLRYNVIGKAVRENVDAWENEMLLKVQEFDEKVMHSNMSHNRMIREATRFSVENAQRLFDRWKTLDRYLMVKYIDGNVKVENADGFVTNGYNDKIPETPEWPGYTDEWKEAVVRDHGDVLRVVE